MVTGVINCKRLLEYKPYRLPILDFLRNIDIQSQIFPVPVILYRNVIADMFQLFPDCHKFLRLRQFIICTIFTILYQYLNP